jgi:ubiquinone/menaquinone biosynthesis C-methylase UbiE
VSSAQDIYRQAHRIAFGPLTFQAVLVARDRGLLAAVEDAGSKGLGPDAAARALGIPLYAAKVLLEGCAAAGALDEEKGSFRLNPVGLLLLHDELVQVNMNFTQDVCYQGAFHLKESLERGKPAGLQVFGPWDTIYQGLLELPEAVRKSWLDFDHHYSDAAFPEALQAVFREPVASLLDIGGNTGKWALLCLGKDPGVKVCIVDHPKQLEAAQARAREAGLQERLSVQALDLLDHGQAFPQGFDVVWMSQLLDCFGESDIVGILKRGRAALAPGGRLMVLETCWDRQPNPVAQDAVMATSLYFTCMANGASRMLRSDELSRCFKVAGLEPAGEAQFGFHTLFTCRAAQ